MGRNLEIILFVIALTQPGHTTEETTDTTINKCDDNPQYNKTADDYMRAIVEAFTNTVNGKKINAQDTLKIKSDAYKKAAANCNENLFKTWDATVFNDFVAYAINNVSQLQELNRTSQFACIREQKIELLECINVTMAEDYNILLSNILDLSKLEFNDITCPRSDKFKACTLKILKENCTGSVSYVTSLFEHMQEYCKKKDVVISGSSSMKMTAFWLGLILFVVEFTKRTTL